MQLVVHVATAAQPGEDPTSALIRALCAVADRKHPPAPPPPGLRPDDPALAWHRLAHREWTRAQVAAAATVRARAEGRALAARCAVWAFVAGACAALALCAAGVLDMLH